MIGCEAVVVMTNDHLKKYLPAYGDRVGLIAFALVTSRNQNLNPGLGSIIPNALSTHVKQLNGCIYAIVFNVTSIVSSVASLVVLRNLLALVFF
ncbi:hypothetical protein DPMN_028169 [Dreissena polymorpha]|uniref:Uncharacterized protein n=1 Tax=Dreissena polymorpha TaxID=45954 RepID=A0A9D4LU81_DREPO|nr:hypothetical protein DPMN_028169 [Dreissena polymorpha]